MRKTKIIKYSIIFLLGLGLGLSINISLIQPQISNPILENEKKTIVISSKEKKINDFSNELHKKQTKIDPPTLLDTKVNIKQEFINSLKQKNYEKSMKLLSNANNDQIIGFENILFDYIKANLLIEKDMNILLDLYSLFNYDNPQIILFKAQLKYYKKEYLEAIKMLYNIKDTVYKEELKKELLKNIDYFVKNYLEYLNANKNRDILENFLNYLIEKEETNNSYKYSLAMYYFQSDNYIKAKKVFTSILEDDTYTNSAKKYLLKIEKKLKLLAKYKRKISLEKVGNHFYINAYVNQESIKLLIDTGATYTVLDTSKIYIEEKGKTITLQTANGTKTATRTKVSSFSIEDVILDNFEVILSQLDNKEFHGLLGMNFLKEFDFYIDQENAILYLN